MQQPQGAAVSSVETLVIKRRKNLAYIKKAHMGKIHYLNTICLPKSELSKLKDKDKNTVPDRWFVLGFALGNLLEVSPGSKMVRAFHQLLEEFDYYCATPAAKSVKLLRAKNVEPAPHMRDGYNPSMKGTSVSGGGDDDHAPVRPILKKLGKDVAYAQLELPNIPCTLDYCEVVCSLCDVLSLLYHTFLIDPSCTTVAMTEAIMKLDQRVNENVIKALVGRLTDLAAPSLNQEINEVLSFVPDNTDLVDA